MTGLRVFEEVVDAFILHEAACEIEVGLTVLNAEVALVVGSQKLEADVQPGQYPAQNVGHGDVLKNAAPHFFGQQPKLGNQLGAEMHKEFAAADTLAKAFDHAVEIALFLADKLHLHGHGLAYNALEADFGSHFGKELNLEIEGLRNGFITAKA